MDRHSKKQLVILICVLLPLVFVFVYGYLVYKQDSNLLQQYPMYTKGVVVKLYPRTRGSSPSIKYIFFANDKEYDGHSNYMSHEESVMIGDTCEVVYASVDPEINKLLKHDDGTLILCHPRLKNIQEMKRIRGKLDKRKKESSGLFD
ncbi:MAG: hypothetical protein LBR57_03960 [Alistipes sp.]|jgi:hypothetical protein|nr:hypothetical protein [Alistipes sp.]